MGNPTAQSKNSSAGADPTVEILYQKMGDRWFAFSMIDDEVFVGSITQEELGKSKLVARVKPPRGNA